MIINNIKTRNFRNYKDLNVNFCENLNVIYGDNAQGKTNIIEAIFLCSAGRSHRTNKDADLVKNGEDFYNISLNISNDNITKDIEVNYTKNKKNVKINHILQSKIGNLMGHLLTVVFAPESMSLIKDGPSERRRFTDISISQTKPMFFHYLQDYNKILKNRNKLLKDIQNNNTLISTIDIWNEKLAYNGARIIYNRKKFIKSIGIEASKKHLILSGGKEEIEIKYKPSFDVSEDDDYDIIQKKYLNRLENSQKNDIIRCTTSYGPHRDDFEIFLNGKSTRHFASQGQQRTAILAIKLAELEIVKTLANSCPVLLLDDVMSELDKNRQEYLLQNIKGIQTFVTVTDKSLFSDSLSVKKSFIKVENGKVFI